jgi:hypothetical protein
VKVRKVFHLLLFTFFLSSCLFDSSSDTITGDYETIWIDIPQTRGISKGETIVPAYVSEIGHNSRFIIAKQHPIRQGNIVTVQTDTTNYYIIEITNNSFQDKPIYGPLMQKEFDTLRRKLNIADIEFDMHYTEFQ